MDITLFVTAVAVQALITLGLVAWGRRLAERTGGRGRRLMVGAPVAALLLALVGLAWILLAHHQMEDALVTAPPEARQAALSDGFGRITAAIWLCGGGALLLDVTALLASLAARRPS